VVELLLKADGVDVNDGDKDGRTPLFIASQEGHSSMVELLLKADAMDVNKGNKDGATPIFIAAEKGHASVVALLEEKLLSIEFLSL
jgi:ankyrin repeat protein